jgi:methylmalonyl-CoA mutase
VIVGVNAFRADPDFTPPVDVRRINNAQVFAEQVAALQALKASRDPGAVAEALDLVRTTARSTSTDQTNLLVAVINAMRVRATVGEVSDAIADVFGRHQAQVRSVSGVYAGAAHNDPAFSAAQQAVAAFAASEGRQPRILVVKLGQDGHDRGAKIIATAFADLGFDVDVGPLFQTPAEAAQDAIDSDVHVLGISSLAAGHLTLVPEIINELRTRGGERIIVIVGGVVPEADRAELYAAGVSDVFGPGTSIADAATRVIGLLSDRHA